MFGLEKAGVKLAVYVISSLIVIALIAGLFWSRGYWKERSENADTWIESVRAVAADITENPKLKKEDVPVQLANYGAANRELLRATKEVTVAINEQGAESKRLKQLNADLRAKAEKLIAERSKLVSRLAERSLDAGDRDNCQEQLGAVVRALNEIYEEGY
jgi:intein/homing endonuclease